MKCRVCGGTTTPTHTAVILKRYEVRYHLCANCQYWFMDDAFWLDEAYSEAVSSMDTGTVSRNVYIHRTLAPTLVSLFGAGPYVDWAGGAGMLVRLMRDTGLDFYWQDAYAENILAKGLEWDRRRNGRSALAVTAMEVLEHSPDPLPFIQEMLHGGDTDTLIFSQELHHGPDPSWWYLAPECGQHISFYSDRTLEEIGRQLGMQLHSAGNLHMLTRRDIATGKFARRLRFSRLAGRLTTRKLSSLTQSDADRAALDLSL
jgi:Methyltransferase domain